VTGDVNVVGVLFSESVAAIAAAGLLLAGMATITLLLDPVLAFATFAVAPVLGLLTFRYTGRVKQLARRQRAEEGRIASAASEALSAMPVVKAFGSESFESGRVERLSETRRAIGVEAARTQARFSGLIDVVGAVAAALAIVFGVFRVAAGALSPGDLVVFAAYASRTYRPMREIARQAAKASRALARADRIAELLSADQILSERPGAFDGPHASADIALEDVSFSYEPGRPALAGLTLCVPAGEHVAVWRRQVDARCAHRQAVRPAGRPGLDRGPRRSGLLARVAARPGRPAPTGHRPVRRHRRREHRVRESRPARRDRSGGPRRRSTQLRERSAGRL
jgi:ABC-type multidrug transport system fused ATPase/permease subunit